MSTVVFALINDGVRGEDGPPGDDGHKGSYGGGNGSRGQRGQDGIVGTHSGSIVAKLATDNSNRIFVDYNLAPTAHNQPRKGVEALQLGNPETHLYLSSRGGDGGHGGRGGDGGNGGAGYAGQNATRYSSGTNGGPGGNGGAGGDGGSGAHSGNGDNITIQCNQEDMDLLMILGQAISNTAPGVPGTGGDGGDGGNGGPGGPGGSSYTWTESYSVSDGRGGSTTQYRSYTNPGGISGPSGYPGADGTKGINGISGVPGVYGIHLNTLDRGVVIYEAPYDLQVDKISFIDTIGYNIIEPDSDVRLMVLHTNVGGMPTPSHQNIMAYIADNKWVYCDPRNRVAMQRWIVEKTSVYLPKEIYFHIRDFQQDIYKLPRNPFIVGATMDHECLVDRVNQNFKRVSATKSPFQVEYPVQSSLIKGLDCVTMGDEAPLVYSIWNKSLLNIGEKASTLPIPGAPPSPDRILFTTVRINLNTRGGNTTINPDDIIIRDFNGKVFERPELGLYSHVQLISPNQLKFASITMAFNNPDIKPYTRVLIESSMYLGHVKDMMNAKAIQSRPFEVQLSEGYLSNVFNCDMLLVVNNMSEYDEITQWKMLAFEMGLSLNIWNSSLYKGFNMSHIKVDGRSLLQDFRCKTIVYLDSNFVKDELLYPASEYIRSKEFLNAAYHHGIHVLLVGKSFNIEKEIFPINTFEKASLVYYRTHKNLLRALKYQIPSGNGGNQVIPPSMAVTTNGDISLMSMVNKKEKYVVLFRQLGLLSFFKTPKSLFPEQSLQLDSFFTLSDFNNDPIQFNLKIHHLDIELEFSKSKTDKNVGAETYALLHEALGQVKQQFSLHSINPSIGISTGAGERRSMGPVAISTESSGTFGGHLEAKFKPSGSYKKLYFELSMDHKVLHQCESSDGKRIGKPYKVLDLRRFSLTRGNQFGTEKQSYSRVFQLVTPDTTWFFKTKSEEDYTNWLSRLSPMSVEYISTYAEPASFVKDQIILKKEDARGIHLSPRSPIVEEKYVPIIQVTGRFVVSKPKEKDLVNYANAIARKLKSRFPNQRNIVVYDYKPKEKSGWNKMTLGNIEIHRSLDQTEPHLSKLNIESDVIIHSPNLIQTPSTLYHFYKVFDFRAKLSLLDTMVSKLTLDDKKPSYIETQSKVGLLSLSIISDLAEEQFHFRNGSNWRDKLSIEKIKLNLLKLNILKKYQFKTYERYLEAVKEEQLLRPECILSDILIEIGVHLKIIIKHSKKGFADTICLRRRTNDVNSATLSLWNDIIKVHLMGYHLKDNEIRCDPSNIYRESSKVSNVEKMVKEMEETKLNTWTEHVFSHSGSWGYYLTKADPAKKKKEKRTTKSVLVISAYRKPPYSVSSQTDTEILLPSVMSKQEFLSNYIPPTISEPIVEERTIFGENQNIRREYISKVQQEKLGCLPENAFSTQLEIIGDYSVLFQGGNQPVQQIFVEENINDNNNNMNINIEQPLQQEKQIILEKGPIQPSIQLADPSMKIPISHSNKNIIVSLEKDDSYYEDSVSGASSEHYSDY
ncbi:hypothetical protein DICPUDRAFT_97676 [Dictyostelium purpureum]|uniref:PH domain-containing protein n=1 Tax=Dictyostelium purpureum TaxID=5786 RepID=F0ZIV0_DICPU|nr:uncharacterized protein DICPUDRAFT_97676 [Dictyostelium purpureum]EGC36138.1 hypothetical protein DICPUDRAFT_97676 [Dictyostelium purpureum]|eukprot:XP_003287331.1 hypothetical protein DICPUDRAFT_97676 [Dictyostelium purpureum]